MDAYKTRRHFQEYDLGINKAAQPNLKQTRLSPVDQQCDKSLLVASKGC
jgi:hypothetical protein